LKARTGIEAARALCSGVETLLDVHETLKIPRLLGSSELGLGQAQALCAMNNQQTHSHDLKSAGVGVPSAHRHLRHPKPEEQLHTSLQEEKPGPSEALPDRQQADLLQVGCGVIQICV